MDEAFGDAEYDIRRERSQALYEACKRLAEEYEWNSEGVGILEKNDALVSLLESKLLDYEEAHPYAERTYTVRRAMEVMKPSQGGDL